MPPVQPQSPNPNFDFMLKDQPQPRRSLLPSLPRPAKIALTVIVIIIVLIVISSLLSGRKNGSAQSFVGVMSRSQETLRVTTLVQRLNLQDPQTQALAATVSGAMTSDQKQIGLYLAKNHIKLSPAQLATNLDKTTDATMQTAAENNGLDAAYVNYLRDALARYEADLLNAEKSAGPNGKALLTASAQSTRTLLSSAPIKS